MAAEPDDLCGNPDCSHPFSEHHRVDEMAATNMAVVGGPWWPCAGEEWEGDGCMCVDFAMPGSTLSIGVHPDQAGDPEGN